MVKKQITQDTFNEVVQENITEFDMSPEEAVNDAVEQFTAQGIDLSNIVKALALEAVGAGEAGESPAVGLLEELKTWTQGDHAASEGQDLDSAVTAAVAEVEAPLSKLLELLPEQENRALAGAKGGFTTLLAVIERVAQLAAEDAPHSEDAKAKATHALGVALQTLAALLEGQPDLVTPPNPDSVVAEVHDNHQHIKQLCEHMTAFKHVGHIQQHGITAIRHACTKHETNRQTFVAEGLIELLLHCVEKHTEHPAAVGEAARCLRILTFDDDIRVAFGKGHEHAKLMVNQHSALARIMNTLAAFTEDAATTAELCKTLAKLAVRNEYCQEIVDLGGLKLLLPSLTAHEDSVEVAVSALQVLRAIAGNDDVKAKIREVGGVEAIIAVMTRHVKQRAVQDKGCAALAAVCLRDVENSKAVIEAGGAHAIVKAMVMFPDSASLQKNAARALRNIAARNPDLRAAILAESAEHYLNVAMERKETYEDAKAALRDLGCKVTLLEPWKGNGKGVKE
ncbi:hypothetical protein PTSG_04942 [Salpingoeca rosetta]|uniref:LRRK2 ARM repeat domain-containing protein n=1 Tax=Salpingoeca rosetta (strain ATCC 50818 / BSB-021) TaxID=946362 RepID=F2U923_SALR5|nr:uncharacterized protein PTSG_04942 [Salpingoeca rosetta]EGD73226.1 hypothetical protein PTSG_04942 [Salpingoeca rosetta]|eukprot:XP_004994257.1 hypothetical protein PTSG_04942 [Salpingoeca rosetta]